MNAISEASEQVALHDSANSVPQTNLLTPEEWAKAVPPFVSIKVSFSEWGEIEYDIALKYSLRIATGWVYYSQKRFVFEKSEDYLLFKMWLDKRPMIDRDLEVE